MILKHPPTTPSDTLTLDDNQAEMGNQENSHVAVEFSSNKVSKTSKFETTQLIMQVRSLSRVQAQSLLTFYIAHLGEVVRYTDHNSKDWDVVITQMHETDDDNPIATAICDFTIDMTMVGVAV